MRFKGVITFVSILLFTFTARAQNDSILVNGRDTIRYTYTPITTESRARLGKISNHLGQSVTSKSCDKKFDFTFVVAPSYSNSTSLTIGAMAAGVYRIDEKECTIQPSTVSIFANASIIGVYNVGIDGINIFKDDKNRLKYRLSFGSNPLDFWGIGYQAAKENSPLQYRSNKRQIEVSYYRQIIDNLYIGARVNFDYIYCTKYTSPLFLDYLKGEKTLYSATGLSLLLEYDTRDFIPNPYRGVFIGLQGMFRPKALGRIEYNCWRVNLNVAYYQKLWRGGILAVDLYGEFNSSHTPWLFNAQLGGQNRMRGYYEGRFSDKNVVTFQAEIRQKVWQNIGVAAWGGVGNCFATIEKFELSHTLPNYGVGLRWEFKERVNLRLDYGFGCRVGGKLINGLLVSINEAF